MIAYDKTLLENTLLVEKAIDLKKSGFIEKSDLDTIEAELDTLKTSRNIFVRLGFLLLGALLYISIIGFVFILILDASPEFTAVGIIIAGIGIGILEILCYQNFFRHGLDDAFVIGAQLILCAAIADGTSSLGMAITMIIIGLLFAIRYVSALSFLIFLSGIVLFIAIILIDYTIVSSILPFVLFGLAVGFYTIYEKINDKPELHFHEKTLYWFFIFSLVLGYSSVNYFVVRTLSENLLDADYSNSDMPFGWIFYVLMFVIPIGYIYYSLKTKNRTMLYIGALTFVLSIATFRYYYSVIPTEWALLLSGSLLFAAVYFVIQKIKDNPVGITFQHDHTNDTAMLNNIEAIIVNSQDLKHAEANDSKMPFGGGDFSGGGSGSSF